MIKGGENEWMNKPFSLRLAKLREKKGVSARDMSLSIGQNPGYISNIETGKSMPSLAGIFYICDFLDITPAEFFDGGSEDPARLKDLIGYLKQLDSEQLNHVTAIVKSLVKK